MWSYSGAPFLSLHRAPTAPWGMSYCIMFHCRHVWIKAISQHQVLIANLLLKIGNMLFSFWLSWYCSAWRNSISMLSSLFSLPFFCLLSYFYCLSYWFWFCNRCYFFRFYFFHVMNSCNMYSMPPKGFVWFLNISTFQVFWNLKNQHQLIFKFYGWPEKSLSCLVADIYLWIFKLTYIRLVLKFFNPPLIILTLSTTPIALTLWTYLIAQKLV